jgi:ribonuclease R
MPKARIYPYDEPILEQLGEQCSMSERRADEATRDVVNWLKCEFMKDRVGETFPGVITAVTGFGLFVELTDIYVEGLVHVTALPGDYYHFDPVHHRLAGERSGRNFRLGDTVEVKVMRVDLDERKIDFEMAQSVVDAPVGRRRGGFESAGKTGRRDGRGAAAGGTDVEKSRELKKSLLAESKGKGRGAKNEPAKPASADAKSAKHRKGPPKSGAPSTGGGPRKRKAKS